MGETQVDRAWLFKEFSKLPDERERAYEKTIVRLALSAPESTIGPLLKKILEDPGIAEHDAYAAYCVLHTCYRRMRDHSQLMLLEKEFAARFSGHPSALHFELLAFVDFGEPVEEEGLLEKAEASAVQMPDNAGALHLLADLVAHYFEGHPQLLNSPSERERSVAWLERGLNAVNRAITLDDYPKFYATRGRLLCLQKQYPEALASIITAIDKEDSGRPDYSIRLSAYVSQKGRIESLMVAGRLEDTVQEAMQGYRSDLDATKTEIAQQKERIDSSTTKNLEFLGLFAGIVSFTIGGINIVSNASAFSFQGAAGLLIVLMGTLLEVFCGFGIVLHGWTQERRSRNVVVLFFGLAMIGLGLALCVWL